MSDIELVLEQDQVIEIEATTTVLVEQDLVTELDPEGEITLQLIEQSTELVVEPYVVLEVEVPGLQGPRGYRGLPGTGVGTTTVLAASTITENHVVALDANAEGFQASADQLTQASLVLGIATASALAGETVDVVSDGVYDTSSSFPLGPLFLGLNGELVSDPSLALFQLQIAVAVAPRTLIVRPQFPIILES